MSEAIAHDQLRAFVERIERVEDEIRTLNDDKRDIYAEARSMGFDVKVLKRVVSERRKDANERAEADTIFDLYWDAVHSGTSFSTPARAGAGARKREDLEWQPHRDASFAELKSASREGRPISQDIRFADATVYAAVFPAAGRIKIGVSNDVGRRLRELQSEVGCDGVLIGTAPGNRQAELVVLEGLQTWKVEGEWFRDEQGCHDAIHRLLSNAHARVQAHMREAAE